MRETHKVLRVYLENEVKDALVGLCQDEGISQSELLERLIREELVRKRGT